MMKAILASMLGGVVCVAGLAASAWSGHASAAPLEDIGPARLYPVVEPVEDGPYTVSIAGTPVPVARSGHIEPAFYVRFALTEPLALTVTVDLPEEHRIILQPRRYRDDFDRNGAEFTLDIPEPGPRVVMMESETGTRHTPLIILAEPDKPAGVAPHDGALIDVSHLAGSGPAEPATEALQAALDTCAKAEAGGVVYLGPGAYHTGHLRVGSNTVLYLAPGATLYGSPLLAKQPRELILFEGVENSGLAGGGVIDGNGHQIRGTERDVSVTLVRMLDSRNVHARDIFLRNAAGWTFHIPGSENVEVDGIRVAGDWGVPNTDGINPDNARNVRIANVFVSGGDDAVCVKATNRYGMDKATRNIDVRDSVVMTRKTALKLGTESRHDIENVVFEHIDVIHASRGLALWMRDGHTFSNVTFRDIRMDLFEIEEEAMSGEPFRFCIQKRDGLGHIRGITVADVEVRAPYRAVFTGRDGSDFEDVTFRNVRWTLTPCRLKPDPRPLTDAWIVDKENELPLAGKPLMAIHRAKGFIFEEVTVDWRNAGAPWDRFADERQSTGIDLDGVTHIGAPSGG